MMMASEQASPIMAPLLNSRHKRIAADTGKEVPNGQVCHGLPGFDCCAADMRKYDCSVAHVGGLAEQRQG